MVRLIILFLLAFPSICLGQAVTIPGTPSQNGNHYLGGRGLITFEGVSGMFLNPTSGTLGSGQFTVQYCIAALEQNNDNLIGHAAMASFGITDWLEVGAQGLILDADNNDDNQSFAVGGPLARIRLIKDHGWQPELSIGGMLREGNENLRRRTIFVAASKALGISPKGWLRAFRLHTGFRQFWQDSDVKKSGTGSIVYVGGEVELPKYLFVVAEVSNKDNVFTDVPYSFGVQLRHPDGIGFSLAAIQPGDQSQLGVFVGIGINFM